MKFGRNFFLLFLVTGLSIGSWIVLDWSSSNRLLAFAQETGYAEGSENRWIYQRVFIPSPQPGNVRKSLNEDVQKSLRSAEASEYFTHQLNLISKDGWELLAVNERTEGIATYWKRPQRSEKGTE